MKSETPTMKVKDLVAHLLSGDQEAYLVTFGHFGEIHAVNKGNFEFRQVKNGRSPQRVAGSYLSVTCPDIGPDPD